MAAVGGKRGMPYVSWAYNYGTVMQSVTNIVFLLCQLLVLHVFLPLKATPNVRIPTPT